MVCALAATLAGAPGSSAKPHASSTQPQIDVVVSAGVMGMDASGFRPDDPLTRRALETLVAGLTQVAPATPTAPAAPVTIARLDARLVTALRLADAATAFQQARAAGLTPPARLGPEAAARLLGLRTNHPAAQDALELLPGETATRTEAAYSAARILAFGGWEPQAVREAAATFTLPALGSWQRRVLTVAVRFIGYPYVWGGESELPESPLGRPEPGGFDCSYRAAFACGRRPHAEAGLSG
jgi:cell wall-associated NlpC family hydrolase